MIVQKILDNLNIEKNNRDKLRADLAGIFLACAENELNSLVGILLGRSVVSREKAGCTFNLNKYIEDMVNF